MGSFLNVLAERLPKGEDVIKGRSHCDFCKHKLRWYELIPLLSFLLQQGKSRCCHKQLSFQHPLIELITGIGFVLLFRLLPDLRSFSEVGPPLSLLSTLYFLFSIVVFCSLLDIFVTDFTYEIIPIEMIITGIIGAFLLHSTEFFRLPFSVFRLQTYGIQYFIPAIFAFLFFWVLWIFSKGKALGDCDMYLAFIIGLLIGFHKIIIFFYVAFLTGAFVGIILILGGKKSLKAHIPFGPFLIWGYIVALLCGDQIVRLWGMIW